MSELIQLARTGAWVPRVEAKHEAYSVYSEFSMNISSLEDLAILSYLYHLDFETDETKQHMGTALETRMTRRGYLIGTLGEIASRLTLKTLVAANMVVGEIDEGGVGGYIVEPFTGKTILPELHQMYLSSRRLHD